MPVFRLSVRSADRPRCWTGVELAPLAKALEDTLALANSDNYMGDLSFYQNVKQAAKRGVAGAAVIHDDLKARFPGRSRQDNGGETPPNP